MDDREPQQYDSPDVVDLRDLAELAEHQVPGDPFDSPFNPERPARDVLDQLTVTRQGRPAARIPGSQRFESHFRPGSASS